MGNTKTPKQKQQLPASTAFHRIGERNQAGDLVKPTRLMTHLQLASFHTKLTAEIGDMKSMDSKDELAAIDPTSSDTHSSFYPQEELSSSDLIAPEQKDFKGRQEYKSEPEALVGLLLFPIADPGDTDAANEDTTITFRAVDNFSRLQSHPQKAQQATDPFAVAVDPFALGLAQEKTEEAEGTEEAEEAPEAFSIPMMDLQAILQAYQDKREDEESADGLQLPAALKEADPFSALVPVGPSPSKRTSSGAIWEVDIGPSPTADQRKNDKARAPKPKPVHKKRLAEGQFFPEDLLSVHVEGPSHLFGQHEPSPQGIEASATYIISKRITEDLRLPSTSSQENKGAKVALNDSNLAISWESHPEIRAIPKELANPFAHKVGEHIEQGRERLSHFAHRHLVPYERLSQLNQSLQASTPADSRSIQIRPTPNRPVLITKQGARIPSIMRPPQYQWQRRFQALWSWFFGQPEQLLPK